MNEKDYYAVLGVEKDATTEQIRKAFQQKARSLRHRGQQALRRCPE